MDVRWPSRGNAALHPFPNWIRIHSDADTNSRAAQFQVATFAEEVGGRRRREEKGGEARMIRQKMTSREG